MTDKQRIEAMRMLLGINENTQTTEPKRKKTRKDYDLQARKDWDYYQTKKNLC